MTAWSTPSSRSIIFVFHRFCEVRVFSILFQRNLLPLLVCEGRVESRKGLVGEKEAAEGRLAECLVVLSRVVVC